MALNAFRFFRTMSCLLRSGHFFIYMSAIFLFSFMVDENVAAQGNLLITPRRIVFEGGKKAYDLNLANIGKDTATYSISLVQIRMKEDGSFETITTPDPEQNFADRNLRYFPRTVTLAPNETQVVKVQLIKTSELTPGEYRSHFYFRAVQKAKPLGEEELGKDTTTISIKLTPIFGITIPAIIRVGESTASVSISDMAFEMRNDTIPELKLTFNRSGNMSVYGDLSVDHVAADGKVTNVGKTNGIAVYTPNAIRKFRLNLSTKAGIDFHSGKLVVTFSAPSDVKPQKFAEAELILSK